MSTHAYTEDQLVEQPAMRLRRTLTLDPLPGVEGIDR
jgi:hypothetical protein